MMTRFFHPATFQLLWLQSQGRRRRFWSKFCQPRRIALSAVACLLTVVWLGNAAMTVWLREQASAETLRALLSCGLVLYAAWHVIKAAFFRPESPLEWSPQEHETLLALPLLPRDLVAYQLASITVTTLLKALLFTLLLLPDLRCVSLGLVGVILAMMLLELIRMAIQIVAWGLDRWPYLLYRTVVLLGLVAAAFMLGPVFVQDIALHGAHNAGEGVRQRLLEGLLQWRASGFGCAGLPFESIVDLIVADALTPANVGVAAATVVAVSGLSAAVIGLYVAMTKNVASRERRRYSAGAARSKPEGSPGLPSALNLPHIPRWGGAGPLVWRQLLGARRHWGSLLTAAIAPAVLAGGPCFTVADSKMAFLTSAGALAFYTFLLLPTALRFDFRRDLDRLATLKSLPLRSTATALGQVLAPIVLTTLFQAAVLAFVVTFWSLSPLHWLLTMLILVPLNALVFGLDNLIYLLYPYRVQQEGLEIFLRTMLTFTGKGLLFTAGLVAMSAWGLAAGALADRLPPWAGSENGGAALFIAGMVAGLSLLAAAVLYGLSRTYRRMDPIEDLPR